MADLSKEIPGSECSLMNGIYSAKFPWMISAVCLIHFILVIWLQCHTLALIRKRQTFLQHQLNMDNQPHTTAVQLNRVRTAAHVTRMVSLVLLLTLLGWGPYVVGLAIVVVCPEACGMSGDTLVIFSTFLCIQSVGNVFIYEIKSKQFKEAFSKILRCRYNRVGPVTTTGNTT